MILIRTTAKAATNGLLAAALLASLSAVPDPSSAAVPPHGLVYGRVTADGAPVSGAQLTLTAWPNTSTLDRLRPGAVVATVRVAVASTDAAGDYAMTPDLARLDPATYREGDGAVSVAEQVVTGSAATTYDFSVATAGTARRTPLLADARTNQQQLSFDLGGSATVTARLTRKPGVTTSAIAVERLSRPADPAGCRWGCPPCIWHVGKKRYPANYERFMSLYTPPRAPATVTEQTGSEHSVGIGMKIDHGSWGGSGSVTWTYSDTATAQLTYLHDLDLFNQINYRMFWTTPNDCNVFDPTARWHVKRQVRPVSWYDMLSWKWPILRKWWQNCARKRRGHWSKEHGTNIKYDVGVSLPFVNLSAQASFSRDTRISWHVKHPVYLCGSTWQGWVRSPRAAARVRLHRPHR